MLLPTRIPPRHTCVPTKPAHLERKAEAAGRILRAISNPRRLILLHYNDALICAGRKEKNVDWHMNAEVSA